MSKSKLSPWVWFFIALVVGGAVQVAQARFTGGWSGLLAAGSDNPFVSKIERELPELVVTAGAGHDGQMAYLVALDPWMTDEPVSVPDPAYRYRRIALPAAASGLGTVGGGPLLRSLTLISLLGFAATSAAAARVTIIRGLPWLAPLAATLNVGLWLSLQITTPDALAFGFACWAIAAALDRRELLASSLAGAAALTKETYVIIGFALLIWMPGQSRPFRNFGLVTAPIGLWSLFMANKLEDPLQTGGNLSLPGLGLVEAVAGWSSVSSRDLAFSIATCLVMGLAIWAVINRRGLYRLLLAPWLLLAAISSHFIWDLGNNSLRAFAPVATLAVVALLDTTHQPSSSRGDLPA